MAEEKLPVTSNNNKLARGLQSAACPSRQVFLLRYEARPVLSPSWRFAAGWELTHPRGAPGPPPPGNRPKSFRGRPRLRPCAAFALPPGGSAPGPGAGRAARGWLQGRAGGCRAAGCMAVGCRVHGSRVQGSGVQFPIPLSPQLPAPAQAPHPSAARRVPHRGAGRKRSKISFCCSVFLAKQGPLSLSDRSIRQH